MSPSPLVCVKSRMAPIGTVGAIAPKFRPLLIQLFHTHRNRDVFSCTYYVFVRPEAVLDAPRARHDPSKPRCSNHLGSKWTMYNQLYGFLPAPTHPLVMEREIAATRQVRTAAPKIQATSIQENRFIPTPIFRLRVSRFVAL